MATKDLTGLIKSAEEAVSLLKALSHEHRLLALCFIGEAEKSVQEIEAFLEIPQSSVSQLLGKLKDKGLVATRRDGKFIYYRIADPNVLRVITALQKIFCPI
jgi:ArsR family transcriptional regulator